MAAAGLASSAAAQKNIASIAGARCFCRVATATKPPEATVTASAVQLWAGGRAASAAAAGAQDAGREGGWRSAAMSSAAAVAAAGAVLCQDEIRSLAGAAPSAAGVAACEGFADLSDHAKAFLVLGLFGGAYALQHTVGEEDVVFSEVEMWVAYNRMDEHGKAELTREELIDFYDKNEEFVHEVGLRDIASDPARLDTLLDFETRRLAAEASRSGSFAEWCNEIQAAGLAMKGNGIRASETNLKRMFHALDLDKNGTLDVEEFVEFGLWACPVMCGLVIEMIQGRSIPEDVLNDMIGDSFNREFFLENFHKWDKDKSGTIDWFEFVLFWQRITEEVLHKFMKMTPKTKEHINHDMLFAVMNKYLANILQSSRR